MIQAEQLHARILEELDLSRDIPDEELTELIHRVLDEASGRVLYKGQSSAGVPSDWAGG